MSKLKNAIEKSIDDEFADIDLSCEEHKFSTENENKILSATVGTTIKSRKIHSKKILAFLVAAILMCLAAGTVGAYKIITHYTTLTKEAHKDYTVFKAQTNDDDPTDIDTVYEVENVPQGFDLVDRKKEIGSLEISMTTTYINSKIDVELTLQQYVKSCYSFTLGGPYMAIDEFTDENGIKYNVYDWGMGMLVMVWEQDGYAFKLMSMGTPNFTMEQMEQLRIKISEKYYYNVVQYE